MSEATQPATTPAPEMPQAKPAKIEQNGIVRPKAGTIVGRIWEFCDTKSAELGAPVKRSIVLEALSSTINAATVATQYGRWRKFHGLVNNPEDKAKRDAEKAVLAEAKAKEREATKAQRLAEQAAEKAKQAAEKAEKLKTRDADKTAKAEKKKAEKEAKAKEREAEKAKKAAEKQAAAEAKAKADADAKAAAEAATPATSDTTVEPAQ